MKDIIAYDEGFMCTLKSIYRTLKSIIHRTFSCSQENVFYTQDFLKAEKESGIVTVGKYTYGNVSLIGSESKLCIGNFCSIAQGCTIFLGHEHLIQRVTTYPFCAISKNKNTNKDWGAGSFTGHPGSKGDVRIGNDVWIGHNATILSGVTIADGAVVGAHALVSKNIPPYAVFGGNPARLIKYRFDAPSIARLLDIEWWNWDDEEIKTAIPFLLSKNINALVDYYDSIKIKKRM